MTIGLNRTRLLAAVLGWLVWVPITLAQEGVVLNLPTALMEARQYQPALEALRLERSALGYRVDTARLAPPLVLGVDLENIAGTGELRGAQSAELTLSLSSVLELGGKADARGAVAGAENELRDLQLQALERDVLGEVAIRFLDVAAAQGPKGKTLKRGDFPYFVAVLGPQEEVLQRQSFSTTVPFDNVAPAAPVDASRTTAVRPGKSGVMIEQHHLRLPAESKDSLRDHKVVIGFELTPAQLAFNRDQPVKKK